MARTLGLSRPATGSGETTLRLPGLGLAGLTLIVSLGITLAAWQAARTAVESEARLRLDFAARQYADAVQERLAHHEQALWGGVGLLAAAPGTSRLQWRTYVSNLKLQERLPGIQGIGYARRILPAERAAHIATMRAEGFPDYAIRPDEERAEYSSIIYLEPFDWRNQRAFGYDMLTEPVRRTAMHHARDTGRAALSGRVTLVQETETAVQPGFLLYLPVYRTGAPLGGVEDRRDALLGFVYSPFRAIDLFSTLISAEPDIGVEVFDGTAVAPESALYRSASLAGGALPGFGSTIALRIADRSWTLRVSALPSFATRIERAQPRLVLGAGLIVSALATALVAVLAYTRLRVVEVNRRLLEDVHRREQVEEQLRRSEAKFRVLFDHNPQPMWLIDRVSLRFLEVNDVAVANYGYSRAEFATMRLTDIRPPEDVPALLAALADRPVGFRLVGDRRHRLKDGRIIDVEIATHDIELDGQRVTLATARDITERKRAQAAAQENAALARGIIETALDAFVQIDEAGRVLDWNACAERLFGWSRTDAVGQVLASLIVPPAVRAQHQEGLERFLRTGASTILDRRIEVVALRRDGTDVKCELTVTALKRQSGYVFNAFIRDLTERIATEGQLRHAQRMDAIGQLTGGMAHDFNNLLAVIIGNLDMLGESVRKDPRQVEFVERALAGAERGAELTRRLLAFARRQPLAPQVIALNDRLPSMVQLLRRTLGENIHVASQLADALWPTRADPSQVEDALINLAINARDAMPEGGSVTIETANVELDEHYSAQNPEVAPGEYVMLAVTDTGSGMPPEVVERAIEPFFTTKPPGSGTGLGLSMIYGFVKQSGGHLKIYSEVGFGTTVRIYLPRVREAAVGPNAAHVPPPMPTGNERILLVEDNAEVREVATMQLTELGYRVETAESAPQALAMLEAGTPCDLLFTDVVMPGGMTGYQLSEAARRLRPGLKVLISTGYARIETRAGGAKPEQGPVLRKPYRKQELATHVRAVLNGKSG
jgi:PAS domain S-box-containing protein